MKELFIICNSNSVYTPVKLISLYCFGYSNCVGLRVNGKSMFQQLKHELLKGFYLECISVVSR